MKIKVTKPFQHSDHTEVEFRDDYGFSMIRTGAMTAMERAQLRTELLIAIAELEKFPEDKP
jgi:hypothetical protein